MKTHRHPKIRIVTRLRRKLLTQKWLNATQIRPAYLLASSGHGCDPESLATEYINFDEFDAEDYFGDSQAESTEPHSYTSGRLWAGLSVDADNSTPAYGLNLHISFGAVVTGVGDDPGDYWDGFGLSGEIDGFQNITLYYDDEGLEICYGAGSGNVHSGLLQISAGIDTGGIILLDDYTCQITSYATKQVEAIPKPLS